MPPTRRILGIPLRASVLKTFLAFLSFPLITRKLKFRKQRSESAEEAPVNGNPPAISQQEERQPEIPDENNQEHDNVPCVDAKSIEQLKEEIKCCREELEQEKKSRQLEKDESPPEPKKVSFLGRLFSCGTCASPTEKR